MAFVAGDGPGSSKQKCLAFASYRGSRNNCTTALAVVTEDIDGKEKPVPEIVICSNMKQFEDIHGRVKNHIDGRRGRGREPRPEAVKHGIDARTAEQFRQTVKDFILNEGHRLPPKLLSSFKVDHEKGRVSLDVAIDIQQPLLTELVGQAAEERKRLAHGTIDRRDVSTGKWKPTEKQKKTGGQMVHAEMGVATICDRRMKTPMENSIYISRKPCACCAGLPYVDPSDRRRVSPSPGVQTSLRRQNKSERTKKARREALWTIGCQQDGVHLGPTPSELLNHCLPCRDGGRRDVDVATGFGRNARGRPIFEASTDLKYADEAEYQQANQDPRGNIQRTYANWACTSQAGITTDLSNKLRAFAPHKEATIPADALRQDQRNADQQKTLDERNQLPYRTDIFAPEAGRIKQMKDMTKKYFEKILGRGHKDQGIRASPAWDEQGTPNFRRASYLSHADQRSQTGVPKLEYDKGGPRSDALDGGHPGVKAKLGGGFVADTGQHFGAQLFTSDRSMMTMYYERGDTDLDGRVKTEWENLEIRGRRKDLENIFFPPPLDVLP